MNNSDFVDVLDAGDDLLGEFDGFTLLYPFVFDDVVEEFATLGILHDEVNIRFGFDYLGEEGVTS